MPAWIISAGLLTAVAGVLIMFVAHGKLKEAKGVEGFTIALGGLPGSPAIDAATTWGHIGLGVLIFGAALVLVGLAAAAVRR